MYFQSVILSTLLVLAEANPYQQAQNQAPCNHDNCFRGLVSYTKAHTLTNYCSSYLAQKTGLPSNAVATCGTSRISSACKCLATAASTTTSSTTSNPTVITISLPTTTTTSTTTSAAPTDTACPQLVKNSDFSSGSMFPFFTSNLENGGAINLVRTVNGGSRIEVDNVNQQNDAYARGTFAQNVVTTPGVAYTVTIGFQFPIEADLTFISVFDWRANQQINYITVDGSGGGGNAVGQDHVTSSANGAFIGTGNDYIFVDCISVAYTDGTCYINSVTLNPASCAGS